MATQIHKIIFSLDKAIVLDTSGLVRTLQMGIYSDIVEFLKMNNYTEEDLKKIKWEFKIGNDILILDYIDGDFKFRNKKVKTEIYKIVCAIDKVSIFAPDGNYINWEISDHHTIIKLLQNKLYTEEEIKNIIWNLQIGNRWFDLEYKDGELQLKD